MKYFLVFGATFLIAGCKKISSEIDVIDSKMSVSLCMMEGEREYLKSEYFLNLRKSCEEERGEGHKRCGGLLSSEYPYEDTFEGRQRKAECEEKFGS